jgi:uncharacterized membrane protein
MRHHLRFYISALLGGATLAVAWAWRDPLPFAAAGDVFFVSYLAMSALLLIGETPGDLLRRAAVEDEGIVIVVAIALALIIFNAIDIFTALNQSHPGGLVLLSVLAGAPLGWAMLHTLYAHHYANIYYFNDEPDCPPEFALKFPGTQRPGPIEFVYFSFVVGMTAQVSDVLVQASAMRRAVLFHSIVSFFYNTVLIAMAVNAVVAVFQQAR